MASLPGYRGVGGVGGNVELGRLGWGHHFPGVLERMQDVRDVRVGFRPVAIYLVVGALALVTVVGLAQLTIALLVGAYANITPYA